jgi:glycosyltransferase involved in cell wall biosynthesis
MRLLFVARSIDRGAGGVQRMIISIMNALSSAHEVSLLTWDKGPAMAFYPMTGGISWHQLDMGDPHVKATPGMILARFRKIRGLINRIAPDVIVCFQGGSFRSMQLYTAGLSIPLIAAERTSPNLYDPASSRRLITVQFERYRDLYPVYLRNRIVTIPNPVPQATCLARPNESGAAGRWLLLSVGRLGYQKNFSALIDAFSGLAPRFPDWDLRIVGEGPYRNALESQLARLPGLEGRVCLPGTTNEMQAEYAAAHLFCLPSRWEGFPNALAEALAHGLPAVGFSGCDGVPDLIDPGRNGALAAGNGDAAALAATLAPLMADPAKRVELSSNAVKSVAGYQPEEIFGLWERVLRECISDRKSGLGIAHRI